jgi:hypothetical protein
VRRGVTTDCTDFTDFFGVGVLADDVLERVKRFKTCPRNCATAYPVFARGLHLTVAFAPVRPPPKPQPSSNLCNLWLKLLPPLLLRISPRYSFLEEFPAAFPKTLQTLLLVRI